MSALLTPSRSKLWQHDPQSPKLCWYFTSHRRPVTRLPPSFRLTHSTALLCVVPPLVHVHAVSQVSQLSQRVQSTQEVVAIRMDVSRNRIIRAELQLTIASVSLAVVTCIAGFLGMNVEIPAWVSGWSRKSESEVGRSAVALQAGSE